MKLFVLFFLTSFLPLSARAEWTVKSQFELIFSESLFDQVINDYWSALQGSRDVQIPDISTTAQGFPVMISGIHANVDYDFLEPKRISSNPRQWQLASDQLSATLSVDTVKASGTIVRMSGPTRVVISLDAECHNLKMHLPPNLTHVSATVQAEVGANEVHLAIPTYDADWSAGAWVVDSVDCSGTTVDGFDAEVKKQALVALASFHNFDATVKAELATKLGDWSKSSSGMILSSHQLPVNADYVNVFFEPDSITENGPGNGLLFTGDLRFEYPNVNPGESTLQELSLDSRHSLKGAEGVAATAPEMMVPFQLLQSLLKGQTLAKKLSHTLHGKDIAAFQSFLGSSLEKLIVFPELNRYGAGTDFEFVFSPTAVPTFQNPAAGAANQIQANMTLPLQVQMLPQVNGSFTPMVTFQNQLVGPTILTLGTKGQVQATMQAASSPVTYTWDQNYQRTYSPSTYIAGDTVGSQLRGILAKPGLPFTLPSLPLGPTVSLEPQTWTAQGQNLLVGFEKAPQAISSKPTLKAKP